MNALYLAAAITSLGKVSLAGIVFGVLYSVGYVLHGMWMTRREQSLEPSHHQKHPSFFSCYESDSSRLAIDNEVLDSISRQDLLRMSDDERWFVTWYRKRKKKGMTMWSVSGPGSLPDASQAELCREVRAMLTAKTVKDTDIF
jgi:hypothetical protein